jgi:TonB family protein
MQRPPVIGQFEIEVCALRHPEGPRFRQRAEGSRASWQPVLARSLAPPEKGLRSMGVECSPIFTGGQRMAPRLAASLLLLIACVSLSTSQAVPQRIRVSPGVQSGLLLSKVNPVYPPLARQARIQGVVILNVKISKTGDVEDIQLSSGHPMLAPAAITAVKQWKYKPYLLNGEPIEVDTQVQVNFTLSDKPATPPADLAADNPPGTGPGEIPGGVPGGLQSGVIVGIILPPTSGDATHPALPRRVRISSGVAQGLLVHKVNPQYPPDAREQRIQGVVVMKVNIDKEGNVYNVELISGHPLLAPAAIDAVKQWKYKPYLLNGDPMDVETQVQVNFTLGG